MKKLLFLPLLMFSGCSHTVTSSPLPDPSGIGTNVVTSPAAPTTNATTAIEASLPLIRTGAAVATGAVLNFAVQNPASRTKLANEMYAAASAAFSLSSGSFPTPLQFQQNIQAFDGNSNDLAYAQFSTAIAGLYSSYYSKLVTGDKKTAADVLNAIAWGIEDATQSYNSITLTIQGS